MPLRRAIICLVGAVPAERTEEWTEARGRMGLDVLAKARLRVVPRRQTEPGPAARSTHRFTCGDGSRGGRSSTLDVPPRLIDRRYLKVD
jgi:hypothetical protein